MDFHSDSAPFSGSSSTEQIDFGDHVGFVLAPMEVKRDASGDRLTFQRAGYIEPGHEP